ncbi:hypothetical protein [Paenibacillus sp. HB172176]|uniref:hypothetical protein n=1 Tax=Paenibacillus sp. HB172176 TaxID=2493690 RepID=UPI001439B8E2|nr:hypothetical protein [Paenibacillus sp. HB172176]
MPVKLKSIAIASYIMLLYWMSLHFQDLHMIFFPTLGAFGFICITRSMSDLRWIMTISFGAMLISLISATLHMLSSGILSLMGTTLITIWFIHRFKWNAPPIVAIALIPYFSHAQQMWTIPLSVAGALLGLIAVVAALYTAEGIRLKSLSSRWKKSSAATMADVDSTLS